MASDSCGILMDIIVINFLKQSMKIQDAIFEEKDGKRWFKQESYRAKKVFVQDVDGLDTGLGLSGQNWYKKWTPAAAFWIDVSSTQIKFADEKLAADEIFKIRRSSWQFHQF
jgi:hypothetical protein